MNKYFELVRPRHLLGSTLIFLIGTSLFYRFNGFTANLLPGLISFILIYSTVYIFNDLSDLKEDKKHYVSWKANRPLPKGLIKPTTARKILMTNLIIGLLTSLLVNYGVLIINSLIVLLNFTYSKYKIKKKPLIGLPIIATSQLLKMLNGWVINAVSLTGIPITFILIIACSYSTFLSIYKKTTFKKQSNKNKYLLINSIILTTLFILSLIYYPILRSVFIKLTALIIIGAPFIYYFNKDINKHFVKGLYLVQLVYLLVILSILF